MKFLLQINSTNKRKGELLIVGETEKNKQIESEMGVYLERWYNSYSFLNGFRAKVSKNGKLQNSNQYK